MSPEFGTGRRVPPRLGPEHIDRGVSLPGGRAYPLIDRFDESVRCPEALRDERPSDSFRFLDRTGLPSTRLASRPRSAAAVDGELPRNRPKSGLRVRRGYLVGRRLQPPGDLDRLASDRLLVDDGHGPVFHQDVAVDHRELHVVAVGGEHQV